jgi:uncharacterized protein (DUF39 family)
MVTISSNVQIPTQGYKDYKELGKQALKEEQNKGLVTNPKEMKICQQSDKKNQNNHFKAIKEHIKPNKFQKTTHEQKMRSSTKRQKHTHTNTWNKF